MSDLTALRTAVDALRDQPDQLIEIILRQAARIEQLQARIQELEALVRDLMDRNQRWQARVAEVEAAAARPAAPFRIKDHKRRITARRPGRRAGHPGRARRHPPAIDVEIEVPLTACPTCGGPVEAVRPVVQYVEDLPVVRPHVTRLVTHIGRCRRCQQTVRSAHPLQVSRATGAAGVHLGPRAVAVIADLNKRAGLTMRATCRVLQTLFGLSLTPGGLAQRVARLADRLRPAYEQLQTQIRASPVVHSDETSWWVGGPGHWLWVFATPTTTVYRVADTRARDVLTTTLGATYAGVLVSDCLAVYDGGPPVQQKCYAHHLKAVSAVLAEGPSPYAEQWRGLLQAALALKAAPPAASPLMRRALEIAADEWLAMPRPDGREERLRARLAKQRDHLFTFLDHPAVPATNNLAERQLRPAVIARKLSCGNKTPAGARTWEVLASLAATCAQRGDSFLDLVACQALLSPAR